MSRNESPAQFPTESRLHVALNVKSIEESVSFYERLFGLKPAKVRPGYAKFEVEEPSLNLALNEGKEGSGSGVNHFGIQVKSRARVDAAKARLRTAGLAIRDEGEVTCCYSVQYKFWTMDPDGNEWETFLVMEKEAPACGGKSS